MIDWKEEYENLLSLVIEVKQQNTDEFMEYWDNKIKQCMNLLLPED